MYTYKILGTLVIAVINRGVGVDLFPNWSWTLKMSPVRMCIVKGQFLETRDEDFEERDGEAGIEPNVVQPMSPPRNRRVPAHSVVRFLVVKGHEAEAEKPNCQNCL
jgi:hypothetical protein